MKVLLISVNRERMPAPVFPLGLAYLAGALRENGYRVKALDLCFPQDMPGELEQLLRRFQPQAIGLSFRNLDNLTYPNPVSYFRELEGIITQCRRFSSAKLILGGSGFSLAPEEIFRKTGADYGIVGEGEEVFCQLLEGLRKDLSVATGPHLLIRGEERSSIVSGARVPSIGVPDRTPFQTRRYLKEGGMVNVQTKRGCPFSCIYCTYPLLEGRQLRLREVGAVIEEIRQLAGEQGTDYLYFVDDIFNYPPSYAEALCREIVRNRLSFRWSAFVNPGFLTETLLNWMKEAGCAGVEFGTDSGSEVMLRNYKKSFTLQEVVQASRLCLKSGINHCHYLLFGGPGETEETMDESFHLMDELNPTAVIAMLGVRIYPGTDLERLSLAEGIIDRETSLLFPHFYVAPALRGRLEETVREKASRRMKWIVPGLDMNISQALMEGIRRFGVRGPLWELVGRMRRPRVKPLV
jgi:radical SAM superfamily enzyme YgiQ (UPF0313 family)